MMELVHLNQQLMHEGRTTEQAQVNQIWLTYKDEVCIHKKIMLIHFVIKVATLQKTNMLTRIEFKVNGTVF